MIGPAIQAAVTPIGCNKDYQQGTVRCDGDDYHHPDDNHDDDHQRVITSSCNDQIIVCQIK